MLALVVAGGLAGCVAYPTTRTYFEPDPSDGTPAAAAACGWHATRNDSLVRDADGVRIQVSPRYAGGKPLTVTVLVAATDATTAASLQADPAQIRLRASPDSVLLDPVSIKTNVQTIGRAVDPASGSDRGQPPAIASPAAAEPPTTQTWHTLEFPVASDEPAGITIEFAPAAIRVQARPRSVAPFRFRRVERRDWYYGSPNC